MDTVLEGLGQPLNWNAARERTPVAAEYEDCTQRFDMLNSVMEANESTWEPYQNLLNDYRSRLTTWGVDTGARSRTIDHTLRKSSRLANQVLEILEHLHECLQNILDLVETTATPLLAPPSEGHRVKSYFDLMVAEGSSQADAILEHKVQPYLEAITDIFDDLTSLVSSIKDPVPWDNYTEGESKEGLQSGIISAKRMFGKAPPALIERLGYANWKRNRYIQEMRERATPVSQRLSLYTKRGSRQEFPLRMPLRIPQSDRKETTHTPPKPDTSHRQVLRRLDSTAISTDKLSTVSKNDNQSSFGDSALGTSIAGTMEYLKPPIESEPTRYLIPRPPVALEQYRSFICPYCLHDFTVTSENAEADWENHVYTDLEPYLCTYELCPREQKTYGSKDEWFRHELNSHRIPKVYFCQSCNLEYDEQEFLETHLSEMHNSNLRPQELSVIASMCERFSQSTSKDYACNLCGEVTASTEILRDHLADHLEQFALSSIKEEDAVEEDSPLSPQLSDSGSERRFRLGLLELMVEEKIGPILQQSPTIEARGLKSPRIVLEGMQPRPAMSSAIRPSMNNRKESYNITSRAKVHLDQHSLLTGASKKSSQVDSMNVALDQVSNTAVSSKTLRTGLAPKKVEFEGRIQSLKELHNELSVPGHTCFLSGTGGIGKSALAAEYTYRCEKEFSFIFWVQAETPIVCADAFSNIARKVVLNDQVTIQDQERLVVLSREFLEKATERWLLVFDNVDEWLDLKQFLPTNFTETLGSILVTTQKVDLIRMTNWSKTSQINLDCLSLDESRRLLLKYTQPGLDPKNIRDHPEFALAGDVAKLAERLPLALSLIAGYILVSRCSLADFVELWKERRSLMQRKGEISSSITDAALETAWNLGLREVPGDARGLLDILAFMDPDTIQKEMIIDEHEESILEMLHSTEARRIGRMTAQLSERKLITIEKRSGEEIWSIHRTLQAKILQDLNRDHEKRERVYAQAFLLIRKRFPLPSPIQVPEPAKWPACRRYLPHVLSLRKIFTGSALKIEPSLKIAQLFSDGGIGLWERGMTSEGLSLLGTAETILKSLDCKEGLLRANIHVIISLLIQDSGLTKLSESRSRSISALGIREQYRKDTPPGAYTRTDEILLYNAFSDYGCVLLQYNNYQEAEPIFSECFEVYKTWGPPEENPYEFAKYYHHMAFCLMYREIFQEAIEMAEKGLHWVTVATGTSSAHNRWKFDLACIVLQSGNLERALTLHQEILDSRKDIHGGSAFLTMQSMYAVGSVQAYLGNLSVAEALMKKVLDFETSREGSCPEAAIARTKYHLSEVLKQQGKDPEDAQELLRSSLASKEKLNLLMKSQELKPLENVKDEHELALCDHLQPVLDGRFTGRSLLRYLSLSK